MIIIWFVAAVLLVLLMVCVGFSFYFAYKHYHPYAKPTGKMNVHGLNAQVLRITSTRGVVLDGMLLPAEGSSHLIIVAHELGAFKETKLRLARRMVAEGYSVLIFDLRNHGGSSKDTSLWPMSKLFTDDIEAVLRFAEEKLHDIRTVTLHSFSLSTFATLCIGERSVRQPDNIVLDSGPNLHVETNAGNFLDAYAKPTMPAFFRSSILYPLVKRCFEFFSLRMLATSWPPNLSKLKSKMLFIANGKDVLFPEEDIRSVAARLPGSTVWVCKDAPHLQAYRMDPENYEKTLFDFLKPEKTVATQAETS